ncbi:ABC transporter ATP-binding protein [Limnoraphis robusta]|uniref:ABC transporter ATP-binding protein n=1 Tax=Limnoraphis robusta CCNP1315 TaxID=3110306 RepID=A0ABU5U3Q3_9CYAN|nr:ABC transporter ATP-binding protein [Limnoraphis robusta]MEA5521749.1 ABC transporter ATP-binding protein [Limnoraphis robusta CCNP1315]MEA5544439.1 ABC transporter ATP-binding protein [Limnoraphis robusta CCNP1324]
MANVRLEKINRVYNNVTAIEDISLEIPDGEFWVLLGPSGCGKSTILRTIAGLETATSGNLYINNRLVNEIPARQRDVAMVFQNYALYPHMTVAENLAFGLKMRQVESQMIQDRIHKVARSLSIDHLLNRKPKQLSGGQQQRVALGRAIVREPQVFLLDEPLSNLDAQLRDDTRAELKKLHQRLKITTIYVTHDQTEAMTLADKIVVLDQGKIQQIGEPQAVYAKPINQMVATFLGNPPMNILPVTYGNSIFWIGNQSFNCPVEIQEKLHPTERQNFNLGIRPEHIELATSNPREEEIQSVSRKSNQALLSVEVDVIEPLGRETLVRASLPVSSNSEFSKTLIQLITPVEIRLKPGDLISVKLDLNHGIIFAPDTGETLYA